MADRKGRFGIHGGQYVPEVLMNAVNELEKAYEYFKNDPAFNKELEELLIEVDPQLYHRIVALNKRQS